MFIIHWHKAHSLRPFRSWVLTEPATKFLLDHAVRPLDGSLKVEDSDSVWEVYFVAANHSMKYKDCPLSHFNLERQSKTKEVVEEATKNELGVKLTGKILACHRLPRPLNTRYGIPAE